MFFFFLTLPGNITVTPLPNHLPVTSKVTLLSRHLDVAQLVEGTPLLTIAKISVTSPIVINILSRELLAG